VGEALLIKVIKITASESPKAIARASAAQQQRDSDRPGLAAIGGRQRVDTKPVVLQAAQAALFHHPLHLVAALAVNKGGLFKAATL
jgi:hypothetical protein